METTEFAVKPLGKMKVVFPESGSFEISKPTMAMQLEFEEKLKGVDKEETKSLLILYNYVADLAKADEKEKFGLALKKEMDQAQFLDFIQFISGSKKN